MSKVNYYKTLRLKTLVLQDIAWDWRARRRYDRVITDGIHSGIVGKIRNERLQQSSHAIGDTITSTTKPLEQISNSGE